MTLVNFIQILKIKNKILKFLLYFSIDPSSVGGGVTTPGAHHNQYKENIYAKEQNYANLKSANGGYHKDVNLVYKVSFYHRLSDVAMESNISTLLSFLLYQELFWNFPTGPFYS